MQTINAQTIINELSALALTAFDDAINHGPVNFVKIKTSETGTIKLRNRPSNINEYAAKVRKNAAAFGGGLIKTPKARAAVTWPSKHISVVGQLLDDKNIEDATRLATEQLGAEFFDKGHKIPFFAYAMAPVDGLPENFVVGKISDGKWSCFDKNSGLGLKNWSTPTLKSRKAAEEDGLRIWSELTDETKARVLGTCKRFDDERDAKAAFAKHFDFHIDTPASPVAEVVAETIATAQAAAVIEIASEAAASDAIATTKAEDQPHAEEVAEVVAMAEGESHAAGRALIGRVAPAQVERGQVIASKSGNWSAVFFNCPSTGLPSMRFMHSDEDGRGQDSGTYENGRDRMADLQRKAKAADYAATCRAEAAAQAKEQAQAVPVQFERVKAQQVSLAQMIKQGIKPADLVGLGIDYSGDMANPGGEGAIVAIDCSGFSELITVQLEDGREWRTQAYSFNPGIGCRYSINWKMHGRPYLAQLAAAVASQKAARTAKEETQAQAFASETERLEAEYPYLKRVTHGGGKEAAQNVRIMLKRSFPGVKFGVTSDYSKISIKWTDGPTDAQVNDVIGRFDIGRSDTQTDYFYTQESPWSKLFGGVQYLWTSRSESPELVAAVLAQFMEGRALQATADDYIKCHGVFDWRTGDEFTRRQFTDALRSTPGGTVSAA